MMHHVRTVIRLCSYKVMKLCCELSCSVHIGILHAEGNNDNGIVTLVI